MKKTKTPKYLQLSEAQIERQIGDWLYFNKFCFYKINTRGFAAKKKNRDGSESFYFRKDVNPYALTGLPDYEILYRGFSKHLEIKAEDGRQTPNQKEFQSYVTHMGGIEYDVVRSLKDAIESVTAFKTKVDEILDQRMRRSPAES